MAVPCEGLLKSELKRKNIGSRELAERLAAMGVHDSEQNIANKIVAASQRRSLSNV